MPFTDTIAPTHLAMCHRGETPVPVAFVTCPQCFNAFSVLCLSPQNAPSCCCYCGAGLTFKVTDRLVKKHIGGESKPVNKPFSGGLCHE